MGHPMRSTLFLVAFASVVAQICAGEVRAAGWKLRDSVSR